MTELRRAARHSAVPGAAPVPPDGVEPEEVWVPPPYVPTRPGDFVEFAAAGYDTFGARRSRRMRSLLLCLVLVAALAFGGWWFLLRDRGSDSQALTCSNVVAALPANAGQEFRSLHPRAGGAVPKGVPLPAGAPGAMCRVSDATSSGALVVWPHGTESAYAALLTAGGWTSSRTVAGFTFYANGGDRRGIVTTTVRGQLVAMYDN